MSSEIFVYMDFFNFVCNSLYFMWFAYDALPYDVGLS